MRPRRPRIVTLAALAVLFVAGLNLARLQQVVVRWQFLQELLPVSPLYLALSGLVWGLCGLALAVGLWLGKFWARRALLPLALVFSLFYWYDRLFLKSDAQQLVSWPFSVGLNLLLLGVCAWVYTKARTFFGGMLEQS